MTDRVSVVLKVNRAADDTHTIYEHTCWVCVEERLNRTDGKTPWKNTVELVDENAIQQTDRWIGKDGEAD